MGDGLVVPLFTIAFFIHRYVVSRVTTPRVCLAKTDIDQMARLPRAPMERRNAITAYDLEGTPMQALLDGKKGPRMGSFIR